MGMTRVKPLCLARHLSSGSASHAVTEWLIEEGVDVNAVDKFHRTPLEVGTRLSPNRIELSLFPLC
jgi:hypothetical protein